MSTMHRFANRLCLGLFGVLLAAFGSLALGAVAGVPIVEDVLDVMAAQWSEVMDWNARTTLEVPGVGALSPLVLIGFCAAVLACLLLAWFALTRPPTQTSTAVRVPGGAGETTAKASVAEDVIASVLGAHPAVHSVRVRVYSYRGHRILEPTIGVRGGTRPADLDRAVSRSLAEWDELAGVRLPAVVVLNRARADRWRATGVDPRVGGPAPSRGEAPAAGTTAQPGARAA